MFKVLARDAAGPVDAKKDGPSCKLRADSGEEYVVGKADSMKRIGPSRSNPSSSKSRRSEVFHTELCKSSPGVNGPIRCPELTPGAVGCRIPDAGVRHSLGTSRSW